MYSFYRIVYSITNTIRDGVIVDATEVFRDWGYIDGFESHHKMIRGGLGYSQQTLSY